MKVAIVGGGVSGLSCALEASGVGDVTVFHDLPILATTSAVATAIWHVYLVDPRDERVLRWGHRTLIRLCDLVGEPGAGVELVRGVELFRKSEPHRPTWADSAIDFGMLSSSELARRYPGIKWGYRLSAPTANMAKYLPWLRGVCEASGVDFIESTIVSWEELGKYDAVVNCAGLRARDLTDDDELFGVRGQYVVLSASADAEVEDYVGDDEHPEGMAYMIPRDGELLVGGTEEVTEEVVFNISVEDLLERAATFCPQALQGASVKRRVVGIRPCRRSGKVVLGRDRDVPTVIHNYGHGGSGFSLSWGCAEAVRAELGMWGG